MLGAETASGPERVDCVWVSNQARVMFASQVFFQCKKEFVAFVLSLQGHNVTK